VRSIAAAAGVNIAAINYYFKSKDKLIESAMKQTINELLKDAGKAVEMAKQQPLAAITFLYEYLFEGLIRYPNITKAHLHDVLNHGKYRGYFVVSFNKLLRSLFEAMPLKSSARKQLSQTVIRHISGMLFLGLAPMLFYPATRKNYLDITDRKDLLGAIAKEIDAVLKGGVQK
jgi:AcrR family transcriptional regulator